MSRTPLLLAAFACSAALAVTPAAPPAVAKPAAPPAVAAPAFKTNADYLAAAKKLSGPVPATIDATRSPKDQFLVGIRLEQALGVPKDEAAALRWFDAAAARGFAPAQAWAADFYRYGIGGTTVDKPKAAGMYRAAADQGWAYAQVELGTQLLIGDGIPVDMAAGEKQLRAAKGKDPYVDGLLPVLDRLQRDPPCLDSFCAVLRLVVADAQRDFKLMASGKFNENNVADARWVLAGSTACGVLEENQQGLRNYSCTFQGAAAEPGDLVPRIQRTLGLDKGGARWAATDDRYDYDPGPNCTPDPNEPFDDCSPEHRAPTHWKFKPLGYVDYYEYDFDYAKHRDAIAIADRVSIELGPNPWGEGKALRVYTVPHPGGPIENHQNFILYAYDTAVSPTYSVTIDGASVGKMKGHPTNGSSEELKLRVRSGDRRLRITDDANGYWEEFVVDVNAIFDHCFYDTARGINCMSDIGHTVAPVAHR